MSITEYFKKRKAEKIKKLLRQEKVMQRYSHILRRRKDYITGGMVEYQLMDIRLTLKELE